MRAMPCTSQLLLPTHKLPRVVDRRAVSARALKPVTGPRTDQITEPPSLRPATPAQQDPNSRAKPTKPTLTYAAGSSSALRVPLVHAGPAPVSLLRMPFHRIPSTNALPWPCTCSSAIDFLKSLLAHAVLHTRLLNITTRLANPML